MYIYIYSYIYCIKLSIGVVSIIHSYIGKKLCSSNQTTSLFIVWFTLNYLHFLHWLFKYFQNISIYMCVLHKNIFANYVGILLNTLPTSLCLTLLQHCHLTIYVVTQNVSIIGSAIPMDLSYIQLYNSPFLSITK